MEIAIGATVAAKADIVDKYSPERLHTTIVGSDADNLFGIMKYKEVTEKRRSLFCKTGDQLKVISRSLYNRPAAEVDYDGRYLLVVENGSGSRCMVDERDVLWPS